MKKHDEIMDPSSCFNRASSDEQIFVLLGRDVATPAAVRAWAAERVRLNKNDRTDTQIVEALALADAIEAVQKTPQTMPEKTFGFKSDKGF